MLGNANRPALSTLIGHYTETGGFLGSIGFFSVCFKQIAAGAAKPSHPTAQVSGAEKTGIETINADRLQDEPKAYYDLQGRRLNSPRQGLNIIRLASGKSVVVAVK